MKYKSDKTHEIELFMDGIASVCDEADTIKEKSLEKFGRKFEPLILNLLMLRTKDFTVEQFTGLVDRTDAEDPFPSSLINCARRNGLVIVSGYSDDLLELGGAICDEGDCFNGGQFHLVKESDKWKLQAGSGMYNNIKAKWCEGKETDEFGEPIRWTYDTDIPHSDFFMTFRGEPYCKGFVFDVRDLK
ncbi:MAG: hypothetical protein IKI90_08510 [Treponema sp.]|nr:hypothetical protein [Treponema sp.]MBR4005874.1 hypothetical protein [Treponema sp.]